LTFHHEKFAAAGFLNSMNRRDGRMIQGRENSRLAFKSCRSIRIVRESFRKKFDRHAAAQLRVRSLIHLSHAACSQVAGDFVMCEFGSDH
jgi:hypothetical protein